MLLKMLVRNLMAMTLQQEGPVQISHCAVGERRAADCKTDEAGSEAFEAPSPCCTEMF